MFTQDYVILAATLMRNSMIKSFVSAVTATAFLASASAFAETAAPSGEYITEANHRYITFSYDHQGYSNPWLRWRDWTGVLTWDNENPENSSINVVIDASSIDSGVDVFDGHLKGERFFDVENNPEITFVSTSVTKTGDNTGKILGDLTIKGNTKPVTLDVTFNKAAKDDRKDLYKLGFSATTQVKRSDFGLDFLVPVVGDDVNIIIETELTKPAEE